MRRRKGDRVSGRQGWRNLVEVVAIKDQGVQEGQQAQGPFVVITIFFWRQGRLNPLEVSRFDRIIDQTVLTLHLHHHPVHCHVVKVGRHDHHLFIQLRIAQGQGKEDLREALQ